MYDVDLQISSLALNDDLCQPCVSSVGRWDRHGKAGGVCALSADGWAPVGSIQTCASRLWHQEAADQLCCRGRQSWHRHPGRGDHQVWGLRKWQSLWFKHLLFFVFFSPCSDFVETPADKTEVILNLICGAHCTEKLQFKKFSSSRGFIYHGSS